MDQELLVDEAQALTKELDKSNVAPRAVMIATSPETGNWKLWIVPKSDEMNKQEFYRIVAEQISALTLKNIDVGSIELRASTNPAIIGLSRFARMDGMGSVYFSNNSYNGVLLPDGIIIRMAL